MERTQYRRGMLMYFAVVGGDMRQAMLARLLEDDGHKVLCAGLELSGTDCVPLKDALAQARYVVLPLPAGGGETLNSPLSDRVIGMEELTSLLSPQQHTVLAGKLEGPLLSALQKRQIKYIDYFAREELTVKNAGLTAEGAVEILLRELPGALLGARVLIVGFGRIGKLLAIKLRALGAEVSITARRPGDLAFAEALGLHTMETGRMEGRLAAFDAAVNTVPAPVLGERELSELSSGCFCLELASAPGGVDLDAAKSLGIRALAAPGLPGKCAPRAAAQAVRDTVYNIIYELECGTWKG